MVCPEKTRADLMASCHAACKCGAHAVHRTVRTVRTSPSMSLLLPSPLLGSHPSLAPMVTRVVAAWASIRHGARRVRVLGLFRRPFQPL